MMGFVAFSVRISFMGMCFGKGHDDSEGGGGESVLHTGFHICLYYQIQSAILGMRFRSTDSEVSVMGENRGGYGCKDCLYRV